MDYEKLYAEMLNYRNEEQAEKMSAYMLNKFKYIGIRTPERRKIFRDFFKEYKKEQEKSGKINWDFINNCWKNEYRELQYSALDYLQAMKNILTDKDIPKLKTLALSKSWWDTIDCLDMIIGGIALKYPKVNDIILQWSTDENIWLRRIAIDHQLLRKEKTNTELLEKVIKNNFGQTEFFINKAIGWALRDYSKTNPKWVRDFIEKNKDNMAKLSIKEGSKYI